MPLASLPVLTPAVSCPVCQYANGHTFRFCQNCGYVRKCCVRNTRASVACDLVAIDDRISSLQNTALSPGYSKQKQSLRKELEDFLFALPGRKFLFSATPWFLKTQTASLKLTCLAVRIWALGGRSLARVLFAFPIIISDSYIGKLRSIFNEVGRQGEWHRALRVGNPALTP